MNDSGITLSCNAQANTEHSPEEGVTRTQNPASFKRSAESQSFDAEALDELDTNELAKEGDPVGEADTLDRLNSTDLVRQGDPVSDSDLDGKVSTDFLNVCATCSGPAQFLSPIGRLCPDCAIVAAARNGWMPTRIRAPSH